MDFLNRRSIARLTLVTGVLLSIEMGQATAVIELPAARGGELPASKQDNVKPTPKSSQNPVDPKARREGSVEKSRQVPKQEDVGSRINKLFFDFVESDKPDDFDAVQKALVESDFYAPYSSFDIQAATKLLEEGKLKEAEKEVFSSMPNTLLSPIAHLILARIRDKEGNQDGRYTEGMLATRCVNGLLSTGDGTEDRPIRVTHVSDEYDLINLHFKTSRKSQRLISKGDKKFDVIECDNGKSYWFDITHSMRGLERMLEGAKAKRDEGKAAGSPKSDPRRPDEKFKPRAKDAQSHSDRPRTSNARDDDGEGPGTHEEQPSG
jgi:hypothetical protein